MHEIQDTYFTNKADLKSYDIQLGEATSQVQTSLSELRAKLEQVEKLSLTQNGMPNREGL